MTLSAFLHRLRNAPESIEFEDTMAVIDAEYTFTPTAFNNGEVSNAVDQNNGSCKIFAFAQQHSLSADETLACFGRYYRDDVLKNPDGTDHGNIRSFMKNGWIGIEFQGTPLTTA
ncbi:MAG: type III effector [Proteobacteria bacterium]|nr:MAG: type III effector [Pseudomonadota bacterium]